MMSEEDLASNTSPSEGAIVAEDLLQKCHTLLAEYVFFKFKLILDVSDCIQASRVQNVH